MQNSHRKDLQSRDLDAALQEMALRADAEQKPGNPASPVLTLAEPLELRWAVDLSPQLQCCTKGMLHLVNNLSLNAACWQQYKGIHVARVISGQTGLVASLLPAPEVDTLKFCGFSALWFVQKPPVLER